MYDEFFDVQRQNLEVDFDDDTRAKLKCYVYALRSPSDQRIFYIGKAGGNSGQGNQRVLDHFVEAELWLKNRNSAPSDKVRRIAEVWSGGSPVEWFVVRHGLTEEVALDVEASLIDTLGISSNRETCNIVRGHGAYERGLLSADDVAAIAAAPVKPKAYERVFVFQIQNSVNAVPLLVNAVEGNWKVSTAHRKVGDPPPLAVGLVNGVSRVVRQVVDWVVCPPDSRTHRFSSKPATDDDLLNKSFVNIIAPALGYLQYGGGYVIVEFDGKGQFRFIWGFNDKLQWHQC